MVFSQGIIIRDGSVIPKFGKKVGNGNGNSNYRNAVAPKKCGKKFSKFLLKDSRKTVNISVIISKKDVSHLPKITLVSRDVLLL